MTGTRNGHLAWFTVSSSDGNRNLISGESIVRVLILSLAGQRKRAKVD